MQLPWNTSKHVHRHNYTLVTALYVGDKILPSLMVNLLGTNKIHTNDQMISQFARSSQMWFVSAEYVSRFIGAADVRRDNFIFFHCTWYHRRRLMVALKRMDTQILTLRPSPRKGSSIYCITQLPSQPLYFGRNFLLSQLLWFSFPHFALLVVHVALSALPIYFCRAVRTKKAAKWTGSAAFALKAAWQKAKALSRNSGQGRDSRSRLKRDF